MQINSLTARTEGNRAAVEAAIARVLASGWYVLGAEVERFEKLFSAYIGTTSCVGVANGTEALELALKALGAGPGQEVATVANAGMYTATALRATGASPWFMDVAPDTCCVTAAGVRRALGAGVGAVVVTHLYGRACPEISDIADACADAGVALVEDCAQAHGASIDGRRAGSFGDAACFSFYPTKNLGALGDGGAVVTSRPELAERLAALRQYGWCAKYTVTMDGGRNSRLDEIQAAILADLIPGLDDANARRRAIAHRYSDGIRHPLVAMPPELGEEYVAHLYVVRSPRRDDLRRHLASSGIASEVHYPLPDHRQPVFGDRYASLHLPHTEALAREVLTLPLYPEMSGDDVVAVIDAVNGWAP